MLSENNKSMLILIFQNFISDHETYREKLHCYFYLEELAYKLLS